LNLPENQGMFIWRIPSCMDDIRDPSDLEGIVQRCVDNNISWVTIKITQGRYEYVYNKPFIATLTALFFDADIDVWGWGWTYGNDPIRNARKAAELVNQYGMSGFFNDAETDWKGGGFALAARQFSTELRTKLGTHKAIGLCSYRFPLYHKSFPWRDFDFDFHAPQVYWEANLRPTAGWTQTMKSIQQLRSYVADKPIIPVGPTYSKGLWTPTPFQRQQFVEAAKTENCPGWCWWSFQHTRPKIWGELKNYDPTIIPKPVPEDALEQLWLEARRRGWFPNE